MARPDDGASARELANTGGRLKLLWHLQRPGPCGPGKHVALEPHEIPLPLLAMIAQDVVQPDGCNTCPEKGETAVWASPGDMCTLQNAGMLVNHGPLRHCASGSKYRDDYEPSHHVKACLPEADLDYLWNTEPPHCHDGRKPHAKPFIAKEGLLFCGQARGSSPPASDGRMPRQIHVLRRRHVQAKPEGRRAKPVWRRYQRNNVRRSDEHPVHVCRRRVVHRAGMHPLHLQERGEPGYNGRPHPCVGTQIHRLWHGELRRVWQFSGHRRARRPGVQQQRVPAHELRREKGFLQLVVHHGMHPLHL